MISPDLKIDWLYRLKRKILFSLLGVLTATIAVTMVFIGVKLQETLVADSKVKTKGDQLKDHMIDCKLLGKRWRLARSASLPTGDQLQP